MSFGNTVKFAIVFVVVNLHTLSDLSLPLYLAMYVPTVAVVILQYYFRYKNSKPPVSAGLFWVWAILGVFGFAVSLALISPGGSAQGLVRYLFSAPIYLALVLYTENEEDLRRHLVTAVAFFAIASLSIPLQFFTGPISWFADSSERAGLDRFSSLVGNLTSVGIVVGIYIVLSHAAPGRQRWLWVVLMIFPAMLSLQKSAIVNIALGVLILIILNRRSWKKFLVGAAATIGATALAYAFVPVIRERISASMLGFGIDPDPNAEIFRDDVGIWTSVWDRLVVLPGANFDALADLDRPFAYLIGGGFGMASTALVPEEDSLAPMAHNQFAEILTVFGPLVGGLAILILLRVGYLLARRAKLTAAPVLIAVFLAYVVLMVNSLFANGTLYQPSSASIFYIALFAATTAIFRTELAGCETGRSAASSDSPWRRVLDQISPPIEVRRSSDRAGETESLEAKVEGRSPLVSILIITYNQAHLVRETVASCLSQTYENYEIVISDDGSGDSTPDILKELQSQNPEKIRLVLSDVNRGITANCNAGLEKCSGEFVALMGGDDLLLPQKLSAQVAAFQANPKLSLSYHPCKVMKGGVVTGVVGDRPKDRVEGLVDMVAKFGAQLPGPATMVRSSAIPQAGFRSEVETASDWMFFIDVSARGDVERLDQALAIYRLHDGNIGQRYFDYSEDFLKTLQLTVAVYGDLPGVSRAVRKGGTRFLLGIVYRAIEFGRPDLARRYASRLPEYSPRALALLVMAIIRVPGADVAFRKAKAVLKRYV